MSVPLSDTRLTEYRNLLAAEHLTPGPWKVEYESCDCSDYPCGHDSYVSAISAPVPTESSKERLERTGGKTEYYDFYRSEVGDFSAADWELMVAARNGLAELLAEVDRLRAELAEYERTVAYFDEQSKRRKTERDEARAQVLAASTVKCWTNENGRRFVFAEDLAFALGYTPTTAKES